MEIDNMRDTEIKHTKKMSSLDETQLIVESVNQREYFRFGDQRLIEYQLTKANGKIIKLQPDEVEGVELFDWSTF
jgi:hypothetical protein